MTSEQEHAPADQNSPLPGRPVALVTGVGRTVGIGAGIATQLAASGWDIAFTYWSAYDDRMPWGPEAAETEAITRSLVKHGFADFAEIPHIASPTLLPTFEQLVEGVVGSARTTDREAA